MLNLQEKIKECQQNYFQHILRMPTYGILGRYLITTLKEGEREVYHGRDGTINPPNREIGT
jgi:hypothetical protein